MKSGGIIGKKVPDLSEKGSAESESDAEDIMMALMTSLAQQISHQYIRYSLGEPMNGIGPRGAPRALFGKSEAKRS